MILLQPDILHGETMLLEERLVPVRVAATDHEALAMVLRTQLDDAGAMLPMGDVLGWTSADRSVETHIQIAPHEGGSRMRLVVRGIPKERPKMRLYLGLAAAMSIGLGALMSVTGAHGLHLALYVLAPLALMPAAGLFDRWSYDRRVAKLARAGDALVAVLQGRAHPPRTRVVER